ncbi:hypothetical protein [Pseudoxanthomonas sp. PXM02]|uniref:hypothetical protein n=1 Tax=Pseudoxanthomonas sp. PXM02 TaxID=2769294 RepID=UPI00177B0B6A|nr:hypothetical protein [Pseudoxanthomonas sp. PXM02]MBD9478734.1 hypothetical protein [Pseudoxanthomonas sp. PXM02]
MTLMLIVALVLLSTLNIVTSVAILRSPFFNGSQRTLQILAVCLIPVVGAIVCFVFLASQSRDEAAGLDRTAFVDGPCAVDGKPDGEHGCGGGGDGGD